jgi:hypothetical protein
MELSDIAEDINWSKNDFAFGYNDFLLIGSGKAALNRVVDCSSLAESQRIKKHISYLVINQIKFHIL